MVFIRIFLLEIEVQIFCTSSNFVDNFENYFLRCVHKFNSIIVFGSILPFGTLIWATSVEDFFTVNLWGRSRDQEMKVKA